MPHFIELDLFDVKWYCQLGQLFGVLAHPAIHRSPGDLEQARNDTVAGSSHAVEEHRKHFFGGGFAPWGGAGELVATGTGLALPALDRLDMAIFANLWM